jgi:hypothetical protein
MEYYKRNIWQIIRFAFLWSITASIIIFILRKNITLHGFPPQDGIVAFDQQPVTSLNYLPDNWITWCAMVMGPIGYKIFDTLWEVYITDKLKESHAKRMKKKTKS